MKAPLVGPEAVAARLAIPRLAARRLMSSGRIPSLKVAGKWRCEATAIDDFIEAEIVRCRPLRVPRNPPPGRARPESKLPGADYYL